MIHIISRFIPIFLLLAVGSVLRNKKVLQDSAIAVIKSLIVNAALPSVLFISFLDMDVKARYLLLFGATFVFCLILYGFGLLLAKRPCCNYPLAGFFFTGFEFGMVGVALYSSLFGLENLSYILLLGLGHEFFIWFFYAPLLSAQNDGKIDPKQIFLSFLKSPIIIAILSALFFNLTGLYRIAADYEVIKGVISGIEMLAQLTTPLILIAIGYQLTLKQVDWKSALNLMSSRLLLVAVMGSLLYLFTIRFVLPAEPLLNYAFITFMLLPPPFIIPVFLGEKLKETAEFYNNLLVVYTLVTLILFLGSMLMLGNV